MRHWLQNRVDAWVLRRVKRQNVAVVSRNRVYIMPTRFGLGFAIMALIMLVGATNYSNSMAFALTFLLTAIGLVCMHHTHANLANVQIRAGRVLPVYCGELLQFNVQIENPSARIRYDLQLGWPRQPPQSSGDTDATSRSELGLSVMTGRRGWHRCGVLSLSTEFPLGLFRAWTWFELEVSGLVYPKAIDAGMAPSRAGGVDGQSSGQNEGHDEFSGLRSYRAGDSLRTVHWKSVAKGQPPMVKQFSDTASPELWLDWQALHPLNAEARLSQLTVWVLEAQSTRVTFGLRLPGTEIAPALGEEHVHACLKALALFDNPGSTPA